MASYLKTSEDEYGYISTLVRQMRADGVDSIREEGFIRGKSKAYGIPTEDFNNMYKKATSEEYKTPSFSSKAAAIQTVMDCIDLSAIDLDFAKEETSSMYKIGEELGVPGGSEVDEALGKYMKKWLESSMKFEQLLATVYGEVVPLDKVLPEEIDKISYLIAMMRVGYADNKKEDVEVEFINNMGRIYSISQDILSGAINAYKKGHDSLEFSNNGSALFTLREATRLAAADFVIKESEKEELEKIANEINANVDANLVDEIKDAVAGRQEAAKLRAEAFDIYYKKICKDE